MLKIIINDKKDFEIFSVLRTTNTLGVRQDLQTFAGVLLNFNKMQIFLFLFQLTMLFCLFSVESKMQINLKKHLEKIKENDTQHQAF